MRISFRLTLFAVLLACTVTPADPPLATRAATQVGRVTKRPEIRLARDTTRIVKPLKADGSVDYLAAINQKYGKGVTPANNAAVKLLEAFGPAMLPGSIPPALLKALGAAPPDDREYFVGLESLSGESIQAALKGPWREKDYPRLKAWLAGNAGPLARLIEASERPRFFTPGVLDEPDEVLMLGYLLPGVSQYRQGGKALVIRANLAFGAGRFDQGRRDLLAAYRLGVLLGQDPALIVRLVGVDICARAGEAVRGLAASGKLSARQARRLIQDLSALGPVPSIAEPIDEGERYSILELVGRISGDPPTLHRLVGMVEPMGGGKPPGRKKVEDFIKKIPPTLLAAGVDFNDVLRRANAHYDGLVEAMRRPTFAERIDAVKRVRARAWTWAIEASRLPSAKTVWEADSDPKAAREKTRWMGSTILVLFVPALGGAQTRADLAAVRRDLAVVALALRVHHAEKNRYPDKLHALVPRCLKELPKDFCSGKDFLYRRVGADYLLYSVGENMRDDGGRQDAEGDDVVVKTGGK